MRVTSVAKSSERRLSVRALQNSQAEATLYDVRGVRYALSDTSGAVSYKTTRQLEERRERERERERCLWFLSRETMHNKNEISELIVMGGGKFQSLWYVLPKQTAIPVMCRSVSWLFDTQKKDSFSKP